MAIIGGKVVLRSDGRLHVQGSPGLLAGAALPLLQGVLTLVDRGIASLELAWDLASTRPARFLGMKDSPGSVLFDPVARSIIETKLGGTRPWKR